MVVQKLRLLRSLVEFELAAENRRKMQVSDSFTNFIELMPVVVEHFLDVNLSPTTPFEHLFPNIKIHGRFSMVFSCSTLQF
jgi:hypothetical protein